MKSRLRDAIEAGTPPRKGAKLLDETRTYVVDEAELAEWISGSDLFHVSDIKYDYGTHQFKISMTTAKTKIVTMDGAGHGPAVLASQGTLFVAETQTPQDDPPGPHIVDLEGDEGVDDVPSQIAGRRTMRAAQ